MAHTFQHVLPSAQCPTLSMLILQQTGQMSDREGTQGNWAPDNAFSVDKCGIAAELLTLPSLAVIRIFEYL